MKVLPQNITKGLGGWEKPTNILIFTNAYIIRQNKVSMHEDDGVFSTGRGKSEK